MRALVLPLIAPTPSSLSVDETPVKRRGVICSEITAHRARHVFALLSGCAAKNNQGHEWSQCLSTIIERTHQTADHVFRALLEDWEHLSLVRDRRTNDSALIDHELELPGWRGTYAGLERLNGLLLTVQVHLTLPTASTADTPIGKLVDLIDRMLSALPPPDDYSFGESRGTRTNPEIGRDEPEMLWLWLPQIHLTTLQILEQLIVRLGEDAMALHHRLLSHVLWTFEHEHSHVGIREVVYRVVASMLAYCGPGLPPAIASSLVHCLNRSCKELVTIQEGLNDNDGDKTISKPIPSKGSTNADTYVPGTSFSSVTTQAPSEAQRMAEKMLCAALAYLPTGILSYSVRRKIDQTAILAQSKPLLQASVLCPPSRRRGMQHASLMPFLARQFPQDQGTEALLRPRMPPVQQGIADPSNGFDEGADDQEEIPETTRYSPSSIDDAQNDTVPTNMELDTEKQTTLSSRTSKMASPSAEVQPDASLQPLQPVFEPTVPAKRSLELAFEGTDVTSANEPGNPLAPGAESASKRIREGVIHIPPAIEEDFPPSQLNDPSDAFGPKAIEMSAQTEPLTNPHTVHDTMNDDDSDDSSIPVLDPTWATDEDEEDEEEQE
ncbi:MAG: hypothetical protein L6R40_003339 [Gallowayella cf. fulva]|nr:MAG: hypothetical protein L6R40_003339 [Xanthomendoza cf. fulva]